MRTRTYQGQIGVKGVFIFSTDNLVQIPSGRVSRRNLFSPLENCDVGVTRIDHVQGSGQTPCAATEDKDRRIFSSHGHEQVPEGSRGKMASNTGRKHGHEVQANPYFLFDETFTERALFPRTLCRGTSEQSSHTQLR